MRFYRLLIQYRLPITVFLALCGIVTIAYYVTCSTACAYLRGDIFGIDLKYIGIAYMAAIIVLALFKQADLLRMLVAAGIGVEPFLVTFQIVENVFCPFCLTFGVMIILMYFVNYERTSMLTKWYQKIIYLFGDARIPFTGQRIPLLFIMLVGYIFIHFTFSGSATPSFAADNTEVPSYGKGAWELIIFTDYFCSPCQDVEKELAAEIERLLARGDVKITFADFPGHTLTALYAKYFLAAVAADKGHVNALKARRILFAIASQKIIDQEKILSTRLQAEGIALKMIDPKPFYKEYSALIKRYDITQTPTCVLRFSSTYTKKFTDEEQISKSLIPELRKRFPAEKK